MEEKGPGILPGPIPDNNALSAGAVDNLLQHTSFFSLL